MKEQIQKKIRERLDETKFNETKIQFGWEKLRDGVYIITKILRYKNKIGSTSKMYYYSASEGWNDKNKASYYSGEGAKEILQDLLKKFPNSKIIQSLTFLNDKK